MLELISLAALAGLVGSLLLLELAGVRDRRRVVAVHRQLVGVGSDRAPRADGGTAPAPRTARG